VTCCPEITCIAAFVIHFKRIILPVDNKRLRKRAYRSVAEPKIVIKYFRARAGRVRQQHSRSGHFEEYVSRKGAKSPQKTRRKSEVLFAVFAPLRETYSKLTHYRRASGDMTIITRYLIAAARDRSSKFLTSNSSSTRLLSTWSLLVSMIDNFNASAWPRKYAAQQSICGLASSG